jgi:uncharacterized membrane protein YciS (DUF1049 family)
MHKLFRIIDRIIFILITAIIVVFCLNNNQIIQISLYPLPFEVQTRLFIIVLIAMSIGVVIGFFCSFASLIKERLKNFASKWRIKNLQKKVDNQIKKDSDTQKKQN